MKKITYILFTFLLVSCNWMSVVPDRTDDDLYSLYRQRIENSNKILYNFAYSGTFVTSSDYIGITILDSTKNFTLDKIVDFPTNYFKKKPTGNHLELIKLNHIETTEKDTLLTPVKNYKTKVNDTQLTVTEYNLTYGSATKDTGLKEYEFDNIKETKDSLMFLNVSHKFGGKEFNKNHSFEKGNIKIVEDENNNLLYVEIEQLIIGRGSVYYSTSPFELVPDRPIVGKATYHFYPRNPLSTEGISDIGIWRRIK